MTSITVALFLLTIVVILAVLFYYKRTKRLLHRNREEMRSSVDEAFIRIENLLVRGMTEFETKPDESKTWAIMFAFNRKDMAQRTLTTLRAQEPILPILVIDNGSTDGTREMLLDLLKKGEIDKLLLNSFRDVPQWQKSFAITQALKLLSLERPAYLVWLDDDLEIERPFVQTAISLLSILHEERVKVISMTDNEVEERNHPTIKQIRVELPSGAEEIKIRPTFNGQFDFFSTSFFRELGAPPIGQGFHQWGIEDWYYSRRLQAMDYRAAIFIAADHVGHNKSMREQVQD
jgi:glycosyltransferase involved in cell wall biosynthesis